MFAVFVYAQQFPLATTSKQITVVQQLSYNIDTHTLFENLRNESQPDITSNDEANECKHERHQSLLDGQPEQQSCGNP